jgi:hypothetical protein
VNKATNDEPHSRLPRPGAGPVVHGGAEAFADGDSSRLRSFTRLVSEGILLETDGRRGDTPAR